MVRFVLAFLVAVSLAACGPSGGDDGSGTGPGDGGTNRPDDGTPDIVIDPDVVPTLELDKLEFTVNEDSSISGRLVYKLEPADAGDVAFKLLEQPEHGTVNLSGDLVTFTPDADYHGPDRATISASLGDVVVQATVNITVNPVNDAPSYTNAGNQSVPEDSGLQTVAGFVQSVSPGPDNESSQTVSFTLTNNNNALFSVQPTLDPTGALVYTPAPDGFGTATVTIVAKDSGGTANGGDDTAANQTFTIAVAAINDAPSFITGGNVAVLEDAGATYIADAAWAISKGPNNENSQAVTFAVSNDNSGLFASAPTIDSDGILGFTPADDQHGSATITVRAFDDGGTELGGLNASTTAQFSITVTSVNDVPGFSGAANQAVLEDAGAQSVNDFLTAISAGATNESAQTVTFATTTNNSALFSVLPTISNAGTLSYTPAADAYGVATVSVQARDDGGTAWGGDFDSAWVNFTITVTAVNDAPSFAGGGNQVALEDAGVQSVSNFASSLVEGPSNEAAQTITFAVSNNNSSLFSAQPAIAANGTLSWTPAADANGSATVQVRAWDNGGTTYGGINYSSQHSFTITVTSVNDAPAFTAGPNQAVLEDAGLQTVMAFATGVNAGPADESAQSVTFGVSNDNNSLFSVQPSIGSDGTLQYQGDADAFGTATVTVRAFDDGGTVYSGMDASSTQQFSITVTGVNDAPSYIPGGNVIVFEDAGVTWVTGWAADLNSGSPAESGQALQFVLAAENGALFASAPTMDASGTLWLETAPDIYGVSNISVNLYDDGGTSYGGVSAATSALFSVQVIGVNDAPVVATGGDLALLEDSGAVTIATWGSVSAGAANESWQTVVVTAATNNAGLFDSLPVLQEDGLSFALAADANGSALVTLYGMDNGGTSVGGVSAATPVSFNIVVTAVNDAPTFADGGDGYLLDTYGAIDVAGYMTDITAGPPDENGQSYWFAVTNDAPALFASEPTVDVNGTLYLEPQLGQSGDANIWFTLIDDGGTANSATNQTTVRRLLTIDNINDAPSFVSGGDVAVLEEQSYEAAWASAISPGPGETGQTTGFVVTWVEDVGLFAVLPSVDSDGVLRFTATTDAVGETTVAVVMWDNGGTVGGGVDTAGPVTFTITIQGVNDQPSFDDGGDIATNEDTDLVMLWASNRLAGPADESAQTVTFAVEVDDPDLFGFAPTMDTLGRVYMSPAGNQWGATQMHVTAWDDGGTANGGLPASETHTVSVQVQAVNDAPQFTTGGDLTIPEDDPAMVGAGTAWATGIAAGPADEIWQNYWFEITSDNNDVVDWAGMNAMGELEFYVREDTWGTALMYVRMEDDGGDENGGEFRTYKTFRITVESAPDAPETQEDFAYTTADTPVLIRPMDNDWDPDNDSLGLVNAYGASNGSVAVTNGGTEIEYDPNPAFNGLDMFTYEVSDGTFTVTEVVTVYVGPDAQAPVLVTEQSHPYDGEVLNIRSGFWEEERLAPATFVFDDPLLDGSMVTAAVSFAGTPLVWNDGFNLDTGTAGIVRIWINQDPLTNAVQGAELVIELDGIQDIHGNTGDPVTVTVWYDGVPPEAWTEDFWDSNGRRVVARFSETMDTDSTLYYWNDTYGYPIVLDASQNGSPTFFSINATDDALYALSASQEPIGSTIMIDMSGLTDLAGNPVQGWTQSSIMACCDNDPGPPEDGEGQLERVQFVDPDTAGVVFEVTAAAIADNFAALPYWIAETQWQMRLVFDASIDTESQWDLCCLRQDGGFDELRVEGAYDSVNRSNDSIVFDLTEEGPGLLWEPEGNYRMEMEVNFVDSDGDEWNNRAWIYTTFAIRAAPDDTTAPTINAFVSRRKDGVVPVLRPLEPVHVAFSENIDTRSLLAPGAVTLEGDFGVIELVALRSDLREARFVDADNRDTLPRPLPLGTHTLWVNGLRDLGSPANTMPLTGYPLTVTYSETDYFAAVGLAPDGQLLGPNSRPLMIFSDQVDLNSLADDGPVSERGLRLEDRWGDIWIPVPGVGASRPWDYDPTSIVSIALRNSWLRDGRTYRLTMLPGIRNLDGDLIEPLSLPEPVTFAVVAYSEFGISTPVAPMINPEDGDLEVVQLSTGTFVFEGMEMTSWLDASLRFEDPNTADTWYMQMVTSGGEVTLASSTDPWDLRGEVRDPDALAALVQPGQNDFVLRVTDQTGRGSAVVMSQWLMDPAALVPAAPVVSALPVTGTYRISGVLQNAQEASHVGLVGVAVSVVDTTTYPPSMVRLESFLPAHTEQLPDGSIAYEYVVAADEALPLLPQPLAYAASAMFAVPPDIGFAGQEWWNFTSPSASFGTE